MNCPICNGSKFKQVGNSVYCVTFVKGKLCGVTLKGDLRREYFEKHASHKDRKKYFNEYYHRNKKRFKDGLTISDVAELKFCNISTVWRNKNKLDIIAGTKPEIFIFNNKLLNWKPRRKNDKH